MRLENYTKDGVCRNRSINELVNDIKLRMDEGREILNGTKVDSMPPSKIYEIVHKLKSRTIYSFLHESIFLLLESFQESFISSNNIVKTQKSLYPSEQEKENQMKEADVPTYQPKETAKKTQKQQEDEELTQKSDFSPKKKNQVFHGLRGDSIIDIDNESAITSSITNEEKENHFFENRTSDDGIKRLLEQNNGIVDEIDRDSHDSNTVFQKYKEYPRELDQKISEIDPNSTFYSKNDAQQYTNILHLVKSKNLASKELINTFNEEIDIRKSKGLKEGLIPEDIVFTQYLYKRFPKIILAFEKEGNYHYLRDLTDLYSKFKVDKFFDPLNKTVQSQGLDFPLRTLEAMTERFYHHVIDPDDNSVQYLVGGKQKNPPKGLQIDIRNTISEEVIDKEIKLKLFRNDIIKHTNTKVFRLRWDINTVQDIYRSKIYELVRTKSFSKKVTDSVLKRLTGDAANSKYIIRQFKDPGESFSVLKVDLDNIMIELRRKYTNFNEIPSSKLGNDIVKLIVNNSYEVDVKNRQGNNKISVFNDIYNSTFNIDDPRFISIVDPDDEIKISTTTIKTAWYEPCKGAYCNAVTKYLLQEREFRNSFGLREIESPIAYHTGYKSNVVSGVPDFGIIDSAYSNTDILEDVQVKMIGVNKPYPKIHLIREITKTFGRKNSLNVFIVRKKDLSNSMFSSFTEKKGKQENLIIVGQWKGTANMGRLNEVVESVRECANSKKTKSIEKNILSNKVNSIEKVIDRISNSYSTENGLEIRREGNFSYPNTKRIIEIVNSTESVYSYYTKILYLFCDIFLKE